MTHLRAIVLPKRTHRISPDAAYLGPAAMEIRDPFVFPRRPAVARSAAEQAVREMRTDFTILIVTEAVLLALVTLLLWPLGLLSLAFSLAKGFGLFYLATWVLFLV